MLVHQKIAGYYSRKVREFGCTPFGVDWTCIATQEMRFLQLLKLCDFSSPFSVNDLGCGYGALATFLRQRHGACAIDYLGVDLSKEMVRRARQRWRGIDRVRFVEGHCSPRIADYSVASGIFNVRLDESDDSWDAFISATLSQLAMTSGRGFAVNFIDPPACGGWVPQGLYTTSADRWIEYCVEHLGTDVELLNGYGMREFTLLVRRRPSG